MDHLPVVSPEIGAAIAAEMSQQPGNEYVVKILDRLLLDNPCVANFISSLAMQHSDPIAVGFVGILVYRLLESQMEADQLKREFGS